MSATLTPRTDTTPTAPLSSLRHVLTRKYSAITMPRASSTDTPDQFMPPMLPGQMMVP